MPKKNSKKKGGGGHAKSPPKSSKKSKSESPPDTPDDSSSTAANGCPHAVKHVCLETIKKRLKRHKHGACERCFTSASKTYLGDAAQIALASSEDTWLCLACGFQGCGGTQEKAHMLDHFDQPHTGPKHTLMISLEQAMVWCHVCDAEVVPSASAPLGRAVLYVKQSLITKLQHKQDSNDFTPVVRATGGGSGRQAAEIRGLTNLGNTCFFNSVLQSLSQTPNLQSELATDIQRRSLSAPDTDENDNRTKITLDEPGPVTKTLHSTLVELSSTTHSNVVTPSALFNQICRKVPRFRGYDQQDSHELLTFLLDCVDTEHMERIRSGILTSCGLSAQTRRKDVSDSKLKQIRRLDAAFCSSSTADRVFSGWTCVSIECQTCRRVSVTTEKFLVLSLPIASPKAVEHLHMNGEVYEDAVEDNAEEATDKQSKHQLKKAKSAAKKASRRRRHGGEAETSDGEGDDNGEVDDNGEDPVKDGEEEEETICESHQDKFTDEVEGGETTERRDSAGQDEDSTGAAEANMRSSAELCGEGREPAGEDGACSSKSRGGQQEKINGPVPQPSKTAPAAAAESEDEEAVNDLGECFSALEIANPPTAPEPCSTTRRSSHKETSLFDSQIGTTQPKVDPSSASTTLVQRLDLRATDSSLEACLTSFTDAEVLSGSNSYACEKCISARGPKTKTTALRRVLFLQLPPVLVFHLRRFERGRLRGFSKLGRRVPFQLDLDVAPFCSAAVEQSTQYSLFAVVEHSGTMRGGHYVAYVRHHSNGVWHYASDSSVRVVDEKNVLKAEAYLLFYQRAD